jgi:hypothetical protein
MKERSLLYFITAVIATTLFLVSIIVQSFDWYTTYGKFVMPSMYALFIPVVLLWVGWYFQNKGFLLASSVIVAVLIGQQFESVGVLNGAIFVSGLYAPMVKTTFVLGLILTFASSGLGFYTYLKLNQVKA